MLETIQYLDCRPQAQVTSTSMASRWNINDAEAPDMIMAVMLNWFNTELQAVDVSDLEKIKRVRRWGLGILKVIDEPQSRVARLRKFTIKFFWYARLQKPC